MTAELVRVAAEQRRCALYRHFDDQDVLLYVGITDGLAERTNSGHARTSEWVQFAARAEAEWHDSREDASEAERDAVREERPVFNRQYAEGDVDRRITDYLHGREVRLLNGSIAFYERVVRQFLGTVPDQLFLEVEERARASYQDCVKNDERMLPAFMLEELNFASRIRMARVHEAASVAAFQEVLDFANKRLVELQDPWAAAGEPPF